MKNANSVTIYAVVLYLQRNLQRQARWCSCNRSLLCLHGRRVPSLPRILPSAAWYLLCHCRDAGRSRKLPGREEGTRWLDSNEKIHQYLVDLCYHMIVFSELIFRFKYYIHHKFAVPWLYYILWLSISLLLNKLQWKWENYLEIKSWSKACSIKWFGSEYILLCRMQKY